MQPRHTRWVAPLAMLLALACKGAKTDQPVTTTTARGGSTSPSGSAAAAQGKSMVRLVNAIPGQVIDVAGDERPVFVAVAYRTVSPYVEVKDNIVRFSLKTAGGADVLADNTETLADGYRYTIVAMPGDHGNMELHLLRDEVVPDSGKARVRVVNAAPDLGKVEVAVAGHGDALFGGVDFGHEAGPRDVAPMAATIDIRGDKGNQPLHVRNLNLAAGKSYTIVLAGRRGGFETITFDDAVTGLARL